MQESGCEQNLKNLTVKKLQNELRALGLTTWYRVKQDLVNRLAQALMEKPTDNNGSDTDNNSDGVEDSRSDSSVIESTSNHKRESALDSITKDESILSDIANKDEEGDITENKLVTKAETKKESMAEGFTFKDIEESLESFDGEPGKSVHKWLVSFENIATICKWNEVQKFIYARRLLKGAARLFVESKSDEIKDWDSLKNKLENEFGEQLKSIDLHRILCSRKKKVNETYQEYLYQMQIIAKRGVIDERSVIEYVINGIQDSPSNKAILFEAETIEELKLKLRSFQALKENVNVQRQSNSSSSINVSRLNKGFNSKPGERDVKQQRRCFRCGARNHKASDCPDRERGYRCFKCNEFGHIAAECKSNSAINQVSGTSASDGEELPEMHLKVKMCGLKLTALVDTGSSYTIIKQSVYDKLLNKFPIEGPGITVTGFGSLRFKTMGSFMGKLQIDKDEFDIMCHIVPNEWMSVEMLLGKDALRETEVIIREGRPVITKISEEETNVIDSPFRELNIVELINDQEELDGLNQVGNKELVKEVFNLVKTYNPKPPRESKLAMQIVLKDETPVFQSPRRLSPQENKDVTRQIKEWLEEGIIQPSRSEYASPIVVVKKKDGSNRLCVDFRKLNEKVVRDRYPLPLIEDVLDRLYEGKIYTTLDLRNGFFHVDVAPESRKYTAFVTPQGHFEFLKVPFGFCNSPSVFQRFVNFTFQDLILEGLVFVYVDDLIISAKDEKENVEKLRQVLKVASENGIQFKWEKCQFLKTQINFLGHVVSKGSIKPSPEKTAAVRNFPIPTKVKDVQAFLGLTGFFRKFIYQYSIIAKPLTDLLRKEAVFNFGSDQRLAFELLKQKICEEPVLKLFDPRLETELHTDGSLVGGGAVMLQKDSEDQKFHPVYFISFKTNAAEKNYTSFELEVLAIIKALKKLRCYLLGLPFKIYTDCKAFQLTMKKKDLCSRVARWALIIEEFGCTVHHRSGNTMKHVDALSRFPSVMLVESEVLHRVRRSQEEDEYCDLIKRLLEKGNYKEFLMRNRLLYKAENGDYLLVVPKKMQKELITKVHENGHVSAKKVEAVIKQDYFIPKLGKVIDAVLRNCVACILAVRKTGKAEGFLNTIEKFDRPLHTYHVDHLGPLPSTSKNYRYLFVVVDAFSKFCWLYPVKTTNSEEVVGKLEMQSAIFGDPSRIISDRGAAFVSKIFDDYCQSRNISHVKITTGLPRGNGQVERLNRNLIEIISKLSVDDPQKWFKYVPEVQRILNSIVNRSTNRSPFELMTGVTMSTPKKETLAKLVEEQLIEEFEMERRDLREAARKQILKTQEENCRTYNKRRKKSTRYTEGDLVAVKRSQFGAGLKFYPKFLGPYEIIKVKGYDRYDLRKVGTHEGPNLTSSAADNLKPWRPTVENCSDSSDIDSSETDESQEGRDVGNKKKLVTPIRTRAQRRGDGQKK